MRQRINYTVSGFRRVLFCYINHLGAYAILTSASAEEPIAYGNIGSEIGIDISSTYKSTIYSPLQIIEENGIEGSGGACGVDDVATAKNVVKLLGQ